MVAVDVEQVAEVDGVLGGDLRVGAQAREHAPAVAGVDLREAPRRRSALVVMVGEDEAARFLHRIGGEVGFSRRRTEWSGGAAAGHVELEAVERADQAVVPYHAAGLRTEGRTRRRRTRRRRGRTRRRSGCPVHCFCRSCSVPSRALGARKSGNRPTEIDSLLPKGGYIVALPSCLCFLCVHHADLVAIELPASLEAGDSANCEK